MAISDRGHLYGTDRYFDRWILLLSELKSEVILLLRDACLCFLPYELAQANDARSKALLAEPKRASDRLSCGVWQSIGAHDVHNDYAIGRMA